MPYDWRSDKITLDEGRRDTGDETVQEIAGSYNVHNGTISQLVP